MALHWDLNKCKDFESLKTDAEWAVTDAIIWYTVFTDIGWEITEQNAPEFYARISFFEKLNGPILRVGHGDEMEDYFITPEDVHKRIGLKVNVAPLRRLRWVNNKTKRFFEGAIRDYEKATKAEEVVA